MMRRFAGGLCLLAVVAGCGESGPAKTAVTGAVTLDGQPLPEGEIQFHPTDGTGGPSSGPIKDGKFSFDAVVGPKTVKILGFSPTGPAFEGKPTVQQILPARYNDKTELTADVQPGMEELKFDLTGGKKK